MKKSKKWLRATSGLSRATKPIAKATKLSLKQPTNRRKQPFLKLMGLLDVKKDYVGI